MPELGSDLQRLLARELQGFRREIELFPDDDSVWRTVPGIANSAGNLALHIAGNVQHFVGHVLGGSAYVRNRDNEFGQRRGTRAALVDQLAAAERSLSALATVHDGALDEPFPVLLNGMAVRTRIFLLHLLAHAAFHLGQAGYLRRVLTTDATSADPLPLAPLAD